MRWGRFGSGVGRGVCCRALPGVPRLHAARVRARGMDLQAAERCAAGRGPRRDQPVKPGHGGAAGRRGAGSGSASARRRAGSGGAGGLPRSRTRRRAGLPPSGKRSRGPDCSMRRSIWRRTATSPTPGPTRWTTTSGSAERKAAPPTPIWPSSGIASGPGLRRGTDALLHYAGKGEARGLPPGPNFDPRWYRRGLWLADGESPLAHFLAHRTAERLAPCPALWSVANAPLDPAAPAGDRSVSAIPRGGRRRDGSGRCRGAGSRPA